MKTIIFSITVIGLFVSTGWSYTYTITEYQYLPSLSGTQSMLITDQGGGGAVYLSDNSSLKIESTSPLEQFLGGVWEIHPGSESHLEMSGGQVHEIAIGNDATAYLSGGLIQQIWSSQIAWKWDDSNQQWIQNPHITIECSDHSYDDITNLLTGHWLDNGDPFSIYLSDVPEGSGYPPAIDNIRFVPEPATLLLLGIGGLALHSQSERNLPFQKTGGKA